MYAMYGAPDNTTLRLAGFYAFETTKRLIIWLHYPAPQTIMNFLSVVFAIYLISHINLMIHSQGGLNSIVENESTL